MKLFVTVNVCGSTTRMLLQRSNAPLLASGRVGDTAVGSGANPPNCVECTGESWVGPLV